MFLSNFIFKEDSDMLVPLTAKFPSYAVLTDCLKQLQIDTKQIVILLDMNAIAQLPSITVQKLIDNGTDVTAEVFAAILSYTLFIGQYFSRAESKFRIVVLYSQEKKHKTPELDIALKKSMLKLERTLAIDTTNMRVASFETTDELASFVYSLRLKNITSLALTTGIRGFENPYMHGISPHSYKINTDASFHYSEIKKLKMYSSILEYPSQVLSVLKNAGVFNSPDTKFKKEVIRKLNLMDEEGDMTIELVAAICNYELPLFDPGIVKKVFGKFECNN